MNINNNNRNSNITNNINDHIDIKKISNNNMINSNISKIL